MNKTLIHGTETIRRALVEQPRIRIGVWFVLGLLGLNLVLSLADARRDLVPEIERQARLYHHLDVVLADSDWQTRLSEANDQLQQIHNRLYRAETTSLARAEFQSMLEREAQSAGLQISRLEMQAPAAIGHIPGLFKVGATLRLQHDPRRLLGFLAALENRDGLIVVDELRIDVEHGRADGVLLHAVYQVSGSEGDEA
ncbi:GspMb/PilO family protein [Wenzhouxiangella limi]|uniref:Uncharacterized protein n=1 Tax=Wenzhouxiangella limi TaxID=2707351 RepID=A0A845V815_9GAMM|nr:GspMb/PilO family protein [Wenzhouxiangella limi]NDY96321.1 hypothetical protein [Wenzhouxiangella limi]